LTRQNASARRLVSTCVRGAVTSRRRRRGGAFDAGAREGHGGRAPAERDDALHARAAAQIQDARAALRRRREERELQGLRAHGHDGVVRIQQRFRRPVRGYHVVVEDREELERAAAPPAAVVVDVDEDARPS
jgi:hypothetical protein